MTSPMQVAQAAARAMNDRKAEDVLVLDISKHTLVADYFVIGSAETNVQIKAITDAVADAVQEAGGRLLAREGHERARWVLLDFGAVVVHIFGPEARSLYRLERLWADAPIVAR